MNLVGEVRSENNNELEKLDFLAELEQLMARYMISSINVSWKFGTDWTGMFNPEQPEVEPDPEDIETTPPRNVAILEQPKITPKKPFIPKGTVFPNQERLDVLEGVVEHMDQEEAEQRPEAGGEDHKTPLLGCDCELRDRAWNPNTGLCETCGNRFRDLRTGQRNVTRTPTQE